MRSLSVRIPLGLAAALFAGFAALQHNDPDPVQWMTMYGAATAACAIAAVRGEVDFRFPLLVLGAAAVWAAIDLPEVIGQKSFIDNMRLGEGMRDPQTEVSREVGGLLMIVAVMLPLAIASFRARAIRNTVVPL